MSLLIIKIMEVKQILIQFLIQNFQSRMSQLPDEERKGHRVLQTDNAK